MLNMLKFMCHYVKICVTVGVNLKLSFPLCCKNIQGNALNFSPLNPPPFKCLNSAIFDGSNCYKFQSNNYLWFWYVML